MTLADPSVLLQAKSEAEAREQDRQLLLTRIDSSRRPPRGIAVGEVVLTQLWRRGWRRPTLPAGGRIEVLPSVATIEPIAPDTAGSKASDG